MSERVDTLVARLRKGMEKTDALFRSLRADQWSATLYPGPPQWSVRDLLAHFLSAEEGLLRLAQDIAAGGPGVPEEFVYDEFNAQEQDRLAGIVPERLLADLRAARQRTIAWVEHLAEEDLDRTGRHPALGQITLEACILAIYGHQLLHARELSAALP